MYTIYLITNTSNNKLYVGQTKQNPKKRWIGHLSSARNGRGRAIGDAIREHGEDSFVFSVIEEVDTAEEANSREVYWISELSTLVPDGYNLATGGHYPRVTEQTKQKHREDMLGVHNPMYGKPLTPEHRQKIRESMLGEDNHFFGKHHSEDQIAAWSDGRRRGANSCNFGRKRSPETKAKMSEALSGENNPNFGKTLPIETRKKISKKLVGREFSDEHRARISAGLRGREVTEETRAKISKANSGKNSAWFGRKHTPEELAKISAGNKGKKLSDETKAKLSQKAKERWEKKKAQPCEQDKSLDKNDNMGYNPFVALETAETTL